MDEQERLCRAEKAIINDDGEALRVALGELDPNLLGAEIDLSGLVVSAINKGCTARLTQALGHPWCIGVGPAWIERLESIHRALALNTTNECRDAFAKAYPFERIQALAHSILDEQQLGSKDNLHKNQLEDWLILVAEYYPARFAKEPAILNETGPDFRRDMWQRLFDSRMVGAGALQDFMDSLQRRHPPLATINPSFLTLAWARRQGSEDVTDTAASWSVRYLSELQKERPASFVAIASAFMSGIPGGNISQFLGLLGRQPLGDVLRQDEKLASTLLAHTAASPTKFNAMLNFLPGMTISKMRPEDMVVAIKLGYRKIVRKILREAPDINQQIGQAKELMAVWALRSESVKFACVDGGDKHYTELALLLEASGAELDLKDGNGWSVANELSVNHADLADAWRARSELSAMDACLPGGRAGKQARI
jgi:hypothetical protein